MHSFCARDSSAATLGSSASFAPPLMLPICRALLVMSIDTLHTMCAPPVSETPIRSDRVGDRSDGAARARITSSTIPHSSSCVL
jgi:hypothetical protein